MLLLCRYDMLFTLETKNIKTRHFFRLRDLSVMSLCRKCEPGFMQTLTFVLVENRLIDHVSENTLITEIIEVHV